MKERFENAFFSGMSAGYGENITFRCYDGYHLPTGSDSVVTELSLKCVDEGLWDKADELINCEGVLEIS